MYHLLPYNASDAPDASNSRSDNNHDPNNYLHGDKKVSEASPNNHGRCNECNPGWILPDDKRN